MKRILFILAAIHCIPAFIFPAPVYNGSEGYITAPSAEVLSNGTVSAALKYTYMDTFTGAVNIVLLPGFEAGAGWDVNTSPQSPVLAGVKYQFLDNPALAVGFTGEISTGQGQNYYTIYIALQEKMPGFDTTLSFGYTVGMETLLNFSIGFQKELFIPQFCLIGDFSNYPYKYFPAVSYNSPARGIVNLGLRLYPFSFLSIDIIGLDVMDGERDFAAGVNFSWDLWGVRGTKDSHAQRTRRVSYLEVSYYRYSMSDGNSTLELNTKNTKDHEEGIEPRMHANKRE